MEDVENVGQNGKSKKLGLIAYASQTGLGYQTKAIYDNLKPDVVLLVDLSKFNNMPVDYNWYKEGDVIIYKGIPDNDVIHKFVDKCESIIVCETPLNYELFRYAKEKGVKTYQQINPEFIDYFKHPEYTRPDMVMNPTNYMESEIKALNVNYKWLPLPMNVKDKREIKELKTIGHIVGRPTYMDRNGTVEWLEAIKIFGNRFKYVLYYQEPKDGRAMEYFKPVYEKIVETQKLGLDFNVMSNIENNDDMYKEMDLLVLPRKYGGLCLPMREALGYGIPVIMPNIDPNYQELPQDWLFQADLIGSFYFHAPVRVYKASVDSIVRKINEIEPYINNYNAIAYSIALRTSWEIYKPLYQTILNG